jgi:hypothetical protein
MAVHLRVEFRGVRDLERALAKMRRPGIDPILRRGMRRAALRIQSRTRVAYLSGQLLDRITGELADSIEIEESGLPMQIAVGSHLVQSEVLHEGSQRRGMPSRPFLTRALDDVIGEFPDIFVEEMERAIA